MTESEKRSAAEALRVARASIQKWWVQGSLVDSVDIPAHRVEAAKEQGDEVVAFVTEWGEKRYRAVRGTCAIGAVSYAEGLVDSNNWFKYPAEDDPLVLLLDAALPKNVHTRLSYTKQQWAEEMPAGRVIEFNDHPDTTKRMVVGLFSRAIKLAEDPEYSG
jgi:hypothetical protein